MLWTLPTRRHGSLWNELDRLQRDMPRLFGPLSQRWQQQGNYPAVNIRTGEDSAVLTAELPGVDAEKLDITVKNNTVTIRGEREPEELRKGESYMRQERGAGQFVRSFSLPFPVDSDKVEARYERGVLHVTLPRHEADLPRRINIKAG